MTARALVAAALAEALGDTVEVIDTFTTVGEREPDAPNFSQVLSAGYLPSDHDGILKAQFEVWLCVATRDPNEAEAELEQVLPAFLAMLNSLNWLEWTEARPGIHPDNYYGYAVTITTITESII